MIIILILQIFLILELILKLDIIIKLKTKKAIKLTIITDSNGIIQKFHISRSSKHDAMILEDVIQNDFLKNKDEMILVGERIHKK